MYAESEGEMKQCVVRSCMTLFKYAAPEQELFQKVLDKFCRGMEDDKTVEILGG